MRTIILLFIFLITCHSIPGQQSQKHRVIILTDIEADPDDTQSLVRLFLYSNELDIKGLIATTSCWHKTMVNPEQITVKSGQGFGLDAFDTIDPDGDSFSFLWLNYPDAGTWKKPVPLDGAENIHGAYIIAPKVEKEETAHFILKVTDKGSPRLSAYKRVIVTIKPE